MRDDRTPPTELEAYVRIIDAIRSYLDSGIDLTAQADPLAQEFHLLFFVRWGDSPLGAALIWAARKARGENIPMPDFSTFTDEAWRAGTSALLDVIAFLDRHPGFQSRNYKKLTSRRRPTRMRRGRHR